MTRVLRVSVVMGYQRGLGVHTMNMLQVSQPCWRCVLRVFLSVNVCKCVYPECVYILFYECVVIRLYPWAASVCPESVSLCCVLVCPQASISVLSVSRSAQTLTQASTSVLSVSGCANGLCVIRVCQCIYCAFVFVCHRCV